MRQIGVLTCKPCTSWPFWLVSYVASHSHSEALLMLWIPVENHFLEAPRQVEGMCHFTSKPLESLSLFLQCQNAENHPFWTQKSARFRCENPRNPKYPPPAKTRNCMDMEVFSFRKNTEILGVHKIGAAISGPRIADKNSTDTRIFLATGP